MQDPVLFVQGNASVRNFAALSTLLSNLLRWYGLSQKFIADDFQGIGELLISRLRDIIDDIGVFVPLPFKNRLIVLFSVGNCDWDPAAAISVGVGVAWLLFHRNVLGNVWLLVSRLRDIGVFVPPPQWPPDSNLLLWLVVLPPDSKRMRARLTFPVTTGDGDRRLIDRGVTRVEGGFEGVVPAGYWRGLKGLAWGL